MKSLIKIIADTGLGRSIRQVLKIKPASLIYPNFKENVSVSDAFLWRTDNQFFTLLKFTDLLRFFYNDQDSYIQILIFNNKNEMIKSVSIKNPKTINEIIIDKNFLSGLQSYGAFYIFHKSKNKKFSNHKIRNSCYTGYSLNNQIPSFVHGNTPSMAKSIGGEKTYFNFSKSLPIFKSTYRIQNSLKNFDKIELCFINPMKKTLFMNINGDNLKLKNNCSYIFRSFNDSEYIIKSNCSFLRPIIFNYKDGYYDVYHG